MMGDSDKPDYDGGKPDGDDYGQGGKGEMGGKPGDDQGGYDENSGADYGGKGGAGGGKPGYPDDSAGESGGGSGGKE